MTIQNVDPYTAKSKLLSSPHAVKLVVHDSYLVLTTELQLWKLFSNT
ncbi:unnamed protein product [Rhodiola kirilowii]